MCWQSTWAKESMKFDGKVGFDTKPDVRFISGHNDKGTHIICKECKLNDDKDLKINSFRTLDDITEAIKHLGEHCKAGHRMLTESYLSDWFTWAWYHANASDEAHKLIDSEKVLRARVKELEDQASPEWVNENSDAKFIYRARCSWEDHSYIRCLRIDKMHLINETPREWIVKWSGERTGKIDKQAEEERIFYKLEDMKPYAIGVATKEIERILEKQNEMIDQPKDSDYFTFYHPFTRDGHIEQMKEQLQCAKDELMRVREMFRTKQFVSNKRTNQPVL